MRRARYRTALLAFLGVIGFLLQPIICAWEGFEAGAVADASAGGGSSRHILQRAPAPVASSVVTTGGHSDNADCCSDVRLSDSTKPPLAEVAPLHFDCFLALVPPRVTVPDRPVGYVVRAAWYRPPNPMAPYCARSARLLF